MKYGIVLKSKISPGFLATRYNPNALISEHGGNKSNITLTFDSIADAEVYAQNHELKNYNIEPVQ